jgi:hypothetical protein
MCSAGPRGAAPPGPGLRLRASVGWLPAGGSAGGCRRLWPDGGSAPGPPACRHGGSRSAPQRIRGRGGGVPVGSPGDRRRPEAPGNRHCSARSAAPPAASHPVAGRRRQQQGRSVPGSPRRPHGTSARAGGSASLWPHRCRRSAPCGTAVASCSDSWADREPWELSQAEPIGKPQAKLPVVQQLR